jgi:Glutamine synthetase, beta-Grasp domain
MWSTSCTTRACSAAFKPDSFSDGIGFDGSSIRGFQEIQESDMLVVPDPASAFLDPFTEAPTLVLICNISDPVSGRPYSRDARHIAQKAETYLKSTRISKAVLVHEGVASLSSNPAVTSYMLCTKHEARVCGLRCALSETGVRFFELSLIRKWVEVLPNILRWP